MPQYNDGKVSGNRVFRRRYRKRTGPVTRREVAKIAKKVAESLPEVKHVSGNAILGIQPSGGAPIVVDLAALAQGTTENTRIGNHIRPSYIGVRYSIVAVDGSVQIPTQVRVMVVQYKPNSAAAGDPTWNQLLQSVAFPWSYRDTEYSKQFKVLYDAKHLTVGSIDNEAFTLYGEAMIPAKKLSQVSYNDNLTTGENKLYLMAISDYAGADFAWPTLNYTYRVRYTDC